ncbi:hypothetical protein [Novosphingobium sp. B 225]|uniref:hypothetical protein n=1 Tax=Novosphingobium sp. B 225 TaxID=1961849 RepID=UPI001595D959|nr:hypothetical protein [Novosphingobium sp. B 225]
MTKLTKSLCWASAFLALAFANRVGLIADKDATMMFALLPALWVATRGRCRAREQAA